MRKNLLAVSFVLLLVPMLSLSSTLDNFLSENHDRSNCVTYNLLGIYEWQSGQVTVTVFDSYGDVIDTYTEPCEGRGWFPGW